MRPPSETFDDRLELRVGDRDVTLIELGPAHTAGDTIVHVPDSADSVHWRSAVHRRHADGVGGPRQLDYCLRPNPRARGIRARARARPRDGRLRRPRRAAVPELRARAGAAAVRCGDETPPRPPRTSTSRVRATGTTRSGSPPTSSPPTASSTRQPPAPTAPELLMRMADWHARH